MVHTKRARYTLEFKLEAVRLMGAGQSVAAVAAILGLPEQIEVPPDSVPSAF